MRIVLLCASLMIAKGLHAIAHSINKSATLDATLPDALLICLVALALIFDAIEVLDRLHHIRINRDKMKLAERPNADETEPEESAKTVAGAKP